MNIKRAAEKFNLKEKEIRELAKNHKIKGAKLTGKGYIIPDDTPVIITDQMARACLLKILKLKNNSAAIISTFELANESIKRTWYEYLLSQEFIGDCEYTANPKELLLRMQLTNKGFEFVIGKKAFLSIENVSLSPIINFNFNPVNASVIP